MNRKKFLGVGIALLVGSTLSFGQNLMTTESKQCNGLTKDSVQCKNITKKSNSLCHNHDPNHIKESENKSETVICSGITKNNSPCKNKTKNESGYCYLHESQCNNCDEID